MAWYNFWRRPKPPAPEVALPTRVSDGAAEWSKRAFGRDGLVNLAAGLGGQADRTEQAQYTPVKPMSQIEAANAYHGSWLPRRIVDIMAEDMTREWLAPTWKDHDNDKKSIRTLQAEENRLNVQGMFTEGIRWGRCFGGATVIFSVKGQKLEEPLDIDKVGKGDLEWLTVRDRWYMPWSGSPISDPGPMMGLPEKYQMTNAGNAGQNAIVHHTHVIRLGGDRLPVNEWLANGRWDESVLQAPKSAVKRFDAAHGGAGSLIWDAKTDVLTIHNLAALLAMDGGEAELQKRFGATAFAKSLFNVLLLDGEDKYERKEVTFAGLKDMIAEFRTEVAGASGYPLTILYGESPGGMDGSGDHQTRSYYDKVNSKQESDLRPGLRLIYELLCRSAFNKMPEEFDFTFNKLWQMTDKEQADVEKTRAERDQIYYNMGAITNVVVAKTLQTNRTYPDLKDEHIELLEELQEQDQELSDAQREQQLEQAQADPNDPGGGGGGGGGENGEEGATPPELQAKDNAVVHVGSMGDVIRKVAGGYEVFAEKTGESLSKPYASKAAAAKRLGQIEYFKAHGHDKNDGSQVVSRREFQGFQIAVENPAGSVRQWRDQDSQVKGQVTMKHDYGFFDDYIGADGDELDVYVGPHEQAKHAYVVHQLQKGGSKFDEDKVFLGFRSPDEAVEAFRLHRDDGLGAFGGMAVYPLDRFRQRLARRQGTGKITS